MINSSPTPQQLQETISRLEQSNRKLRRMVYVVFTCTMLLLLAGITERFGMDLIPREVIRAKSIILEDANGIVRAELSATESRTMVSLFNDQGLPSIAMASTENEPGVHVYDEQGIRKAAFGLNQDGASLTFMDNGGLQRSGLITLKDGRTSLIYRDAKGKIVKVPFNDIDLKDPLKDLSDESLTFYTENITEFKY